MAMVGDELGDAIEAAIDSYIAALGPSPTQAQIRTAAMRGLGNAIVTYVQANATVGTNVSIGTHPPGGAATGTGVGSVS